MEAKKVEDTIVIYNSFPTTITLIIHSQDGDKTYFMVKRKMPVKRVLTNYCRIKFLEYESLHFLIDGERFSLNKTPSELGLMNGDQIDAMMHMDGGGMK